MAARPADDRQSPAVPPADTPAPADSSPATGGAPPGGGPGAPAGLPPELASHPVYEVLRPLGRGGMGVVYLARNKLMNRLEVLKVMQARFAAKPGLLQRFTNEV